MSDERLNNQQVEELQKVYAETEAALEKARHAHLKALRELAKVQMAVVVPSEFAINTAKKCGPMDDAFFNVLAEDAQAIEEIVSAVLGIPVLVKDVSPQYTITNIGTRGVRLDAVALVVPQTIVTVELMEDCYLGLKGAFVDVEVQKEDEKDCEFRVYYNGASLIVHNTPRGIKSYNEISRAVVIMISSFDPFGNGEMFYETVKRDKKSNESRKSPVTEIYINTQNIENADRSSERMLKIADLLKVFRDLDHYDSRFPAFSKKKKELRETEKGVIKVSREVQVEIDKQNQVVSEQTAELMMYLYDNGRVDDARKASTDGIFLKKLLSDFMAKKVATAY